MGSGEGGGSAEEKKSSPHLKISKFKDRPACPTPNRSFPLRAPDSAQHQDSLNNTTLQNGGRSLRWCHWHRSRYAPRTVARLVDTAPPLGQNWAHSLTRRRRHAGTTYSCVATYEGTNVEIIANEQGSFTTPSFVSFTEDERLIGEAAKNQAAMNPVNTVFDVKYGSLSSRAPGVAVR